MFGAMLGPQAETAVLLDELTRLAGAQPASAETARQRYRDLKRSLAGLGPAEPELVFSKSEFFRRPLPDRAITGLLDTFGHEPPAGQRRELNFTPMGGAYNRVPAQATAFAHREERFLLEHVAAQPPGPPIAAPWVRRSWATVRPWGSGRVYPNFPDPDLTDPAAAYHGANHARLARAKRTYDPHRLLHFPQSL